MGVFLATCGLHAAAIYGLATVVVTNRSPLWEALEVSFIPAEQPTEPPPPKAIPVLLSDAFAERPVMDIPPPAVELATAPEGSEAIHLPPPDPTPPVDLRPEAEQGYGPLSKPQVISGPKYPQDRYPRISIRHRESGRTVVRVCISASGTVDSVEVAQSSGFPRLDAAAADMTLDYTFAPATREGKAVPVCLPYGIDFRLAIGGSRRGS